MFFLSQGHDIIFTQFVLYKIHQKPIPTWPQALQDHFQIRRQLGDWAVKSGCALKRAKGQAGKVKNTLKPLANSRFWSGIPMYSQQLSWGTFKRVSRCHARFIPTYCFKVGSQVTTMGHIFCTAFVTRTGYFWINVAFMALRNTPKWPPKPTGVKGEIQSLVDNHPQPTFIYLPELSKYYLQNSGASTCPFLKLPLKKVYIFNQEKSTYLLSSFHPTSPPKNTRPFTHPSTRQPTPRHQSNTKPAPQGVAAVARKCRAPPLRSASKRGSPWAPSRGWERACYGGCWE